MEWSVVELCGSTGWVMNEWVSSCNPAYASSTQCIVPYEAANPPYSFTTGAVSPGGLIPMRSGQLAFIQTPEGNFLVETKDECPACRALQIDTLTTDPLLHYSYNLKDDRNAEVCIWIAVPKLDKTK